MSFHVRQGATAGVIIALLTSLLVGVAAETFWRPFLTALGFSLLCVCAATSLLVIAQRTRHPR